MIKLYILFYLAAYVVGIFMAGAVFVLDKSITMIQRRTGNG